MADSLSIQEARKLVLHSQQLPGGKATGPAVAATLSSVEHLGYIQIDTISVIQRAHHHTLWNRNPRYQASQLDELIERGMVFEYWSHAAAYLPMRDFRFSLPRKRAIASGEREHWYDRDKNRERAVLKRIKAEGPLLARDFEHGGKKTGEWGAKPAKKALVNLFMQGELMSLRRSGFQKVYDLTERALPAHVDTRTPTREEYGRFLITSYLKANGLGRAAEIAYLRPECRGVVSEALQDMASSGELLSVRVGQQDYAGLPDSMKLLDRPLARNRLKILSPFDNLVIQRKRMQALFGFDYQIECYLPAAKRRYGYFVLPILWDGRLAARMDCKADRKVSVLHIHHLALEPWLKKTDAFLGALRKEMRSFMTFNQCDHVRVHRTSPSNVESPLKAALGGGF